MKVGDRVEFLQHENKGKRGYITRVFQDVIAVVSIDNTPIPVATMIYNLIKI